MLSSFYYNRITGADFIYWPEVLKSRALPVPQTSYRELKLLY